MAKTGQDAQEAGGAKSGGQAEADLTVSIPAPVSPGKTSFVKFVGYERVPHAAHVRVAHRAEGWNVRGGGGRLAWHVIYPCVPATHWPHCLLQLREHALGL